MGPISEPSMFGHRYFLIVVDDVARHTWIFLMRLKSETSTHIKSLISSVETQHNTKVKCVRSNNGREFLTNEFYRSKGIIHQTSCVETPQLNGIVERKHQHVMSMTRALIFQSIVPKCFLTYAVSHAVFLINRFPTRFLSNRSPFEALCQ